MGASEMSSYVLNHDFPSSMVYRDLDHISTISCIHSCTPSLFRQTPISQVIWPVTQFTLAPLTPSSHKCLCVVYNQMAWTLHFPISNKLLPIWLFLVIYPGPFTHPHHTSTTSFHFISPPLSTPDCRLPTCWVPYQLSSQYLFAHPSSFIWFHVSPFLANSVINSLLSLFPPFPLPPVHLIINSSSPVHMKIKHS